MATLGKWTIFFDTYIFGWLGIALSGLTLLFSMQIKKQVNDSLDIQLLKQKQPELSIRINEIIELLVEDKFHKQHFSQIRGIVFEIEANFPVFCESKHNKKIIENLHQGISPEGYSTSVLHENLVGLEASLRKAVR